MKDIPPGTLAVYALVAAAAVATAAVPVCAPAQRELLRAQHLRPSSTPGWVWAQLVPTMYSGAHEAAVGAEPLTPYLLDHPEALAAPPARLWVNHYPGKLIRLDTARRDEAVIGGELHILIESRYRAQRVITGYVVRATERGLEVERRRDLE